MALIKCPECGKEFSDKAPACIHCGCPTPEASKDMNNEAVQDECVKKKESSITNRFQGMKKIRNLLKIIILIMLQKKIR